MRTWPKSLQQVVATARDFFRRHWQELLRIREKLRLSEETVHLLLAAGVGVIGGLVNLLFHLCIDTLKEIALRHQGDFVEIAEALNWWQRLLAPSVGGLAAGLVLFWGLHWAGKRGSSNLLEVVVAGDGRLPFRHALIKAVSSLLSISTGGSIGREGLITHLTATAASKCGQLARWQPYRLRLLVACGAAAGIAAAYNAPVAGAVFAAQIVLGNFSMNLFAPLVLASVVATMVSRSFFGIEPQYQVPSYVEFTHVTQLPWFLLLGLLAGMLGAAFLKLLRHSELLFSRVSQPLYARMALGGLVVGAIATGFPQVWGNGYGATNQILHDQYELSFLFGLFVAKLLATLMTVGSGAVGGVFTPTLFLGAGLGGLFGMTLHAGHVAETLPTAAFALAGMGSVLAATTHSPLLAMIMVFEISLNYTLMPPLMVACAVSTLVARGLDPETIYTEPLRQKGLETERESAQPGAATQQTVGDLMRDPVPPVKQTSTFHEIADRFLTSSNNFLPVVDDKNSLVGLVALQDLKEYLNAGQELNGVIAYDVMRPPPKCLTPNQKLLDALPVLLNSEQRNVPVINSQKERRLVGAVARAEALGLLSEAIAPRSTPGG
ncbi:MAG: voltage-gated chloride channel ClcB [Verrucomicrobia bacterium]|nr:MAG: voltage-gated chloride channel ClcB [Verrucomicrobiota bacterium]